MPTITVVPDAPDASTPRYRAVAGDQQSVGATVGEALDALTAQIGGPDETTLVVIQPAWADEYFSADQRARLGTLMSRWRSARDAGGTLPADEQAELDALIRAEVEAAGRRAAAVLRQLTP
jgi:hypothetical protein